MYTKIIQWFAQTRLGGWLFLNVFNRIDKPLMKLSNARLSTGIGTAMSKNAIMLTCTGAKEAKGAQREELWKLATDQYSGYDTYATRTARVIPVMLLVAAKG